MASDIKEWCNTSLTALILHTATLCTYTSSVALKKWVLNILGHTPNAMDWSFDYTGRLIVLTASSLNYSPKPILGNINEVLGFGWIHICVIELTSAIIELFWASLNCTTASLNQTVASSDMQLLNSTGSALCFKNSMPLETLWDYTGRGCSITDFMDRFHTPTVVGKCEYKNVI